MHNSCPVRDPAMDEVGEVFCLLGVRSLEEDIDMQPGNL